MKYFGKILIGQKKIMFFLPNFLLVISFKTLWRSENMLKLAMEEILKNKACYTASKIHSGISQIEVYITQKFESVITLPLGFCHCNGAKDILL